MDSATPSLDQNIDLSKLSARDKQELQQFLLNESQKSRIQQCTSTSPPYTNQMLTTGFIVSHNLTDMCWTKCVAGTIKSGALDKNEEPCLKNCVDRFLDANFAIIRKLEGMRGGQH